MKKVSIGEAARILGVHPTTLRRWENEGKLIPDRTPSGHRRYVLAEIMGIVPHPETEQITLGYARVSSRDQKGDLGRQVQLLESYCAAHGWQHEVIQDIGSGINDQKRGLRTLLRRICTDDIHRLVLTHRDRLLRFGAELVFAVCEEFGVEVVILNRSENELSFEEELAQDVLEIITDFSARLYGRRSHKNRQLIERLQEAAEEL